MNQVPVTADGRLATPDGVVLDTRFPWMAVLRLVIDDLCQPLRDHRGILITLVTCPRTPDPQSEGTRVSSRHAINQRHRLFSCTHRN